MSRGRVAGGPGSAERTATAVVPLPQARPVGIDLARVLPSARSLLAAVAIGAVALASYFVARDTGVFAIRTVEVDGGSPAVARQVRSVLHDELGTSLMRLDTARTRELVAAVPTVASVTLDRAFPHTLRIRIVPERPVAVVRQGADSWLVSARGRVMARLPHGALSLTPRIWVSKQVALSLGGMAPAALHDQLAAVTPLATMRFPARVASVQTESDELTLRLRSGLQVRLGDATDAALKLAVAAKVLHLIPSDTRYVDVSVPERPVAGSIFHPAKAPATTPGTAPATQAGAAATAAAPPAQTAGTTAATAPASTHDGAATGAATTLNSKVKVEGTTSTGP